MVNNVEMLHIHNFEVKVTNAAKADPASDLTPSRRIIAVVTKARTFSDFNWNLTQVTLYYRRLVPCIFRNKHS